jgi:hypothetical protein
VRGRHRRPRPPGMTARAIAVPGRAGTAAGHCPKK